jgi:formylglycine-generating enzyme required for sulfatase activity
VTIYQALTLELPYGKSGGVFAKRPATAPSRLQPLLPPGMDTVLLKALELKREDRYATMAAFEADWRRVRQGLLPQGGARNPVRRVFESMSRHPREVLVGGLGVLILALLGAALWQPNGEQHGPFQPVQGTSAKIERRTVLVETEPQGARVVLVPIDPRTGDPVKAEAIRPEKTTPLTASDIPVGEYLVEAEIAGFGFHQVYRMVPQRDQKAPSGPEKHRWWRADGDTVILSTIAILRSAEVTKTMIPVPGGDFTMGPSPLFDKTSLAHPHPVLPFYLDPTEVTVGAYRATMKRLPEKLDENVVKDSEAIGYVSYYRALEYAERMGKRLPTEAEHEYVGTNKGTTTFPWGDDRDRIKTWRFDAVGEPAFDRARDHPGIAGLFSNVAEWTSSLHVPYPGTTPELQEKYFGNLQVNYLTKRVVRGGPDPVARRDFPLDNPPLGPQWEPRYRYSFSPDSTHPGLGFRCARSAQLSFLNP